jgi:hypothetical protein
MQLINTRRLADPPPLFMYSNVFRVPEPAAGDETHPSCCRLLARSSRRQMCVAHQRHAKSSRGADFGANLSIYHHTHGEELREFSHRARQLARDGVGPRNAAHAYAEHSAEELAHEITPFYPDVLPDLLTNSLRRYRDAGLWARRCHVKGLIVSPKASSLVGLFSECIVTRSVSIKACARHRRRRDRAGHDALKKRCQVYPRKETLVGASGMSVKCQ